MSSGRLLGPLHHRGVARPLPLSFRLRPPSLPLPFFKAFAAFLPNSTPTPSSFPPSLSTSGRHFHSSAPPRAGGPLSSLSSSSLPPSLRRLATGGGWGGWTSCDALIGGLIGANVLVFALWRWVLEGTEEGRRPMSESVFLQRREWMFRHFTVSWRNVREGRVHTLVTAAFSQAELSHLLLNCLSLFVFARPLCSLLGGRRLLAVYIGGAVMGSLSHLLYHHVLLPRLQRQRRLSPRRLRGPVDVPAMGASASAMACVVLYAALFPRSQFLLYFVVPLPAWLCAAGLVTYDAYAAYADRTTGQDGPLRSSGGTSTATHHTPLP